MIAVIITPMMAAKIWNHKSTWLNRRITTAIKQARAVRAIDIQRYFSLLFIVA
jgi:hypothetical protein